MTDPSSPSTPAASSTSTTGKSTTLRVVGLLLWIAVFACGAYLFWSLSKSNREPDQPTANESNGPRPIAVASLENDSDSNSQETENTHEEEVSGWDPAGIADFEFTERSGRTITKASLLGKHWLVCFVFTRCAGPCQNITRQMYELQDALQDRDVHLVTISVDPEYDTPERLTDYAEIFAADSEKWLYLTGDKDETYRLIRDSFKMPVKEMFGEARKPGWEVLHSANILHVDDKGVVQAKYDATKEAQVHQLVKDIKAIVPPSEEGASNSTTGENETEVHPSGNSTSKPDDSESLPDDTPAVTE